MKINHFWIIGKVTLDKVEKYLISSWCACWQSNALGLCPYAGTFTNQEATHQRTCFIRESSKRKWERIKNKQEGMGKSSIKSNKYTRDNIIEINTIEVKNIIRIGE